MEAQLARLGAPAKRADITGHVARQMAGDGCQIVASSTVVKPHGCEQSVRGAKRVFGFPALVMAVMERLGHVPWLLVLDVELIVVDLPGGLVGLDRIGVDCGCEGAKSINDVLQHVKSSGAKRVLHILAVLAVAICLLLDIICLGGNIENTKKKTPYDRLWPTMQALAVDNAE